MSRPIRSCQEKVSKGFLLAFRNEFRISKGFIVPIVVDESSNIDEYLINIYLFEIRLYDLHSLLGSLLESLQDDVKKCWRLK
jgi:hypothetical protein